MVVAAAVAIATAVAAAAADNGDSDDIDAKGVGDYDGYEDGHENGDDAFCWLPLVNYK